jgi:hypothetical protein
MKTSNKLLLGGFLTVVMIVITANIMFKNELSSTEKLGYDLSQPNIFNLNSNVVKVNINKKKSTALKEFTIVMESTDDGIKMECPKGSTWTKLSFTLNNDDSQAVDEYGMAELDNLSTEKGANLADYLFVVTKTKNKIILKGIEGTNWNVLSFDIPKNKKMAFDQDGVTVL